MKTPKYSIALAVLLGAVLAIPNLAMAGVKTGKGPVGIKLGATTLTTLDVTMTAGAAPYTQTNWNNPTTATGGLAAGGLNSQDGVKTALGVYWSASAGIITAGTSGTGHGRLMASYLDSGGNANTVPNDGTPVSGVALTANGNNEPWLYVTNLTAWLATNGACDYDVVVYMDGVTPGLISHYWVEKAVGLGSSMTVGPNLTPPIYVQQQDLSAYLSSPGYSQASSSSYGSAGPANYMVFPGLTADSILIRSEEDQPAVSNVVRSPISAVQLWPRSSDPVVFNYTPESPRNNAAGDVLRLVNAASGCGISAYQWMAGPIGSGTYTNVRDAGTISGSSTVQLTISNLAVANMAEYVLVASNGTSAVYGSPIQVYVNPVVFTNSPKNTIRYAGGTGTFKAEASGAGTITYQWYKGSSPPYTVLNNGVQGSGSVVSGATNTTLAIGNLHTSDAGTYTIVASSVVGGSVVGRATNSAVLTVLPVVVGSYVESVVTNGAVNFWRLGESDVSELAYDYAGGFDGAYGAASHIGVFNPGPRSTSGYQGFESTNSCLAGQGGTAPVNDSWATVPALNLNTNTVTIVAWVFLYQAQNGGTGILMTRHNGTTAGFGFSAGINGGATNLNELGCVWNNGAAANYHSGLCVSNGVWSMVALVVSPTNLTFYSADTDSGIRSSTIAVNTINEAWAGPGTIGYDDTMGLDRLLNGYIDEVAVFKRSLSAAEIGRLWMAGVYNSVVQLPIITQQPKPTAVYATRTAYFSAVVLSGGTNTTYRWQKVSGTGSPALLSNGSGVSGATTPNLTIASVQSSTVGDYRLLVTNSAGWSASDAVRLSVSNLFGTYETAVVSTAPVAYWRFNESLGSGYAYDCVGGHTAAYDVNALYGYSGPTPPDLPGFENANLAMSMRLPPGYDQSWVEVPPLNLNTNAVTIAAWIYPLGTQQNGAGLVYQRHGTTTAGLNFCNTTSLGYNWSNLSGAYGWNSGLTPPVNQWSFVALVVQPNVATMYLLNNSGQQVATNMLNHPVQTFSGVTQIGNDPYAVAPPPGFGAAGESRTFWGYIDEVAIWSGALSSNQVNSVYAGANQLFVLQQPGSTNTYAGYTIRLVSQGGGKQPFNYRWYSNNVALPENGHFSGTSSSTLTINSITFRDAADYTVRIGNSIGYITSQVATVTVRDPAYRIVFSPTNAISEDALRTNQAGVLVGAATWNSAGSVNVNDGGAVYTYNFTVNGSVATANGTGTGAGAFTHDTGNSDFNGVLNNKRWDQGPKTIVVTNLVAGHRYSVYLFALDDAAAYGPRRAYFQDPNDPSDVSSVFLMSNDVYVVATVSTSTNYLTIIEQLPGFTNDSGALVDVGMGNINALVVRDLTTSGTFFTEEPRSQIRYQGYPHSETYATAFSTFSTTYQWQKNGGSGFTNFGAGGSMTSYYPMYLPSSAGVGDFRMLLHNSSGWCTSQVATVGTVPLPAAQTYQAAILSYNPMAYWQLNEPTNVSVAYDYVGGWSGSYFGTNRVVQSGVPNPPLPSDVTNMCFHVDATNWVAVSNISRTASAYLTIVAWVNLDSTPIQYAGIVKNRGSGRNCGFQFFSGGQLGFDWNNPTGGNGVTYNWASGVIVPASQWCLVALTVSPDLATVYCIDQSGTVNTNSRVGPYDAEDWGGPLYIGIDPLNATWITPGAIDDVAVFERTLSYDEIVSLFSAAAIPAPEAPVNLNVTYSGDREVMIGWDSVPNVMSYIIKRGTLSGTYTPIATNIFSDTGFDDRTVANGTLYHYVVSAVNSGGESSNSAEVSTMPGPPPASFTIDNAYRTTNQVVTFTDTTTNGGYNTDYARLWDFGDGTTGTDRVATHTYLSPYTGPVTLGVTNINGLGASVSHNVYITNSPAGPSTVYPSSVSILRVQVQTNDLKLIGTNWPFGANASYYVRWTNNVGLSKATWVTNGNVVGDQRFNGRDGLFTNVILGGATNGSRGFYFIHAP